MRHMVRFRSTPPTSIAKLLTFDAGESTIDKNWCALDDEEDDEDDDDDEDGSGAFCSRPVV